MRVTNPGVQACSSGRDERAPNRGEHLAATGLSSAGDDRLGGGVLSLSIIRPSALLGSSEISSAGSTTPIVRRAPERLEAELRRRW